MRSQWLVTLLSSIFINDLVKEISDTNNSQLFAGVTITSIALGYLY